MFQRMVRPGSEMRRIFTELFRRNPIQRSFCFLDENARLDEDIRLLASLPLEPFLRALFRVYLLERIEFQY